MKKKSLSNISRSLHRDLGYFFIGITLIYAITGFILSARGLGWFKEEYNIQTSISKNIAIEDFKKSFLLELKSEKFEDIYNLVTKDLIERRVNRLAFLDKKNDIYFFEEKSLKIEYNFHNGNLNLNYKTYPTYLQIFISSHLSNDKKAWFYLALVYSVVLSFFAVSAMFIVKGKYGFKKRGVYLCLLGMLTIIFFLYLSF